ncbi:MAG: DNA gyrase subunit A [Candidatus Berkelbacteria bacterium Licking1014_7]|uniref:DNA gyrase subunit A n=1 Tax=Candidatus Berkelbacteria bacterium Licking1014_7 TaxID=2017147 RepID=A0A554LKL7_9BACT|nr:MAG: DNA gyrase subunit A [Candidatus Berkelbacteria bacterium Licking1014_7]
MPNKNPKKELKNELQNYDKNILPTILEKEMQDSYLDYAMSVIVSRALPDVRDGLKPVHRRILFAMHEMKLRYNAKHRKSATVVGSVLGKYHPHGDKAVYDSMVRMAQEFSMRYKLIDGQGNMGSVDGDSPAAMRYTEAKMARLTDYMLFDIEKETVNFAENFDATRKEPIVLPSRVPNLLINGTLGIAVGMATNILPHNLSEVIDAILAQINKPEIMPEELAEIVRGPDFPTGGLIFDGTNIKYIYLSGKGPVVCRGEAMIDEDDKGANQILISSIPYQVNKADLVAKIANLVKTKKIEGISDIRDESDRKSGVRIVIDLRSNAFAKKILNQIYKLTPLQTVFHMNLVALVDGIQPRLLSLKEIIFEFIKHRKDVVARRTQYELKMAKNREHILAGLKIALDHIDEIVSTIRNSQDREEAKGNLIQKFKFTEIQAIAILEMKLSALAGLERQKVLDELAYIKTEIERLSKILEDPKLVLRIISEELQEIKEKFGDERKTKIFKNPLGKFNVEDLIPDEKVIVTITSGNYIKRIPVGSYKAQRRGGKGIMGMGTRLEDEMKHILTASTHDEIMFFSNLGKIFKAKVFEIPTGSRISKGHSLANVIQLGPDEIITTVLTVPNKKSEGKYLVMATKQGKIKKTLIDVYQNVRKSGIIAIKLSASDELRFVKTTRGSDSIIQVSQNGQAIFYSEKNARPMGRSAAGVKGIKLREGDEVIATEVVSQDENPDLLTILENGYGKRTIIKNNFRHQKRGGIGVRASKVSIKTGKLVSAIVSIANDSDLMLASQKGIIIRVPIKSVKRLGRNTMGVTLMRFKGQDKVSSVGIIDKEKTILERGLGEKNDQESEKKNNVAKPKKEFTTRPISKQKKDNNTKIKNYAQGNGLRPLVIKRSQSNKKISKSEFIHKTF